MATTPTQNSVPSESPLDLKYNAGKIDEFVTSLAQQYIDRFGNAHYTIEGLKQLVLQHIYNLGWNPVGTFQDGTTVSSAGDIVQDEVTGTWYRWDDLSTLPKDIPSGSTPDSTGGVGDGKWLAVDVSDVLRKQLSEENGMTLIGGSVYVVDYFSGALSAHAGKSKFLMTRGHHAIGVGAATYLRDGTTGSPSTGNELKFFDADGFGWAYQPVAGEYDVDAFGLVGDAESEGANNVDKLQAMLNLTGRADFVSGKQYFFNKFYDNLPNTDKCAIILTRKCEVYSRNNSQLVLVGDNTEPAVYSKVLFGATYDGAANGSIFRCKAFIKGAGYFAIFRYVDWLYFDLYSHGGDLPEAITPSAASFGVHVCLWGCSHAIAENCKMYAAKDDSDFTNPRIGQAGFAFRILTSWTSSAVQDSTDIIIRNCEFTGFSYNATEIAGRTTKRVYVHDCTYTDCMLTPLDLDKACQDCHGYDNIIVRPRRGLYPASVGGDAWIPMRIQGFTDSTVGEAFGFGCSLRNNIVIDAAETGDSGSTMVYCLVDRQHSANVTGNRQRNSLANRAFVVNSSDNLLINDNNLYCNDFMNYSSTNCKNMVVRGNTVGVNSYVLNTGTTGNGFASMKGMLWQSNDFRNTGPNAGTSIAADGVYLRTNATPCSGVFINNQFTAFSRAYVTQIGAGNSATFKGNIGVNCASVPAIADAGTQSVEYTNVTGY